MSAAPYHAEGRWIRDTAGRAVVFRGVNLGGDSKIPAQPDGATWRPGSLGTPQGVSFVGRPFPLDEADRHFERLRSWGMRLLRLLVTWEAVEHAGPGSHDERYLDYLRALVEKAAGHGLEVLIDPHQDAWSRWTGGDGAPAWTLTEVGFRLESLHASGAALLHQHAGAALPRLAWPTNYSRLACATMSTLFLGGDVFAPEVTIRDEGVQSFLQRHYIGALAAVAGAVAGLPNVAGFGVMNEPSLGWIGLSNLARLERAVLRKGPMPTPFQAMAAGDGRPVVVERWKLDLLGERRSGSVVLNPAGHRAWAEGVDCVWRRAGVWGLGQGGPRLERPDHFHVGGDPVSLHYTPFAQRCLAAVRKVLPGTLVFWDEPPGPPDSPGAPEEANGIVHAPHWYDGLPMVTGRSWRAVAVDGDSRAVTIGPRALRAVCAAQIARRVSRDRPTLIGEFGLPLDRVRARAATRALTAYYEALDTSLVGGTVWCYAASNDGAHGDQWNREDFSIWSGGAPRGLLGFCRPYAERIAGTPLSMSFDARSRLFELSYRPSPDTRAPTVVYVPTAQYPHGYTAELRPATGVWAERRPEEQRLLIHHAEGDAPLQEVSLGIRATGTSRSNRARRLTSRSPNRSITSRG